MLTVSTQIAHGDDIKLFEDMLRSVSFASEIIIYNMGFDSKELKLVAKRYDAKIIDINSVKIVEFIRERQVREASNDWVLIIDFDEIVTQELKEELIRITSDPSSIAAYKILRKNFSLGFPLSHGGFGADYVHRLFQKKYFVSWPHDIHSTPVVNGEVLSINSAMEHHKDASLSQMVEKTNRYSDIEAAEFLKGGLPPVTTITLFRKPIMEFVRRYFLRQGLLDGQIGLIQAIYQSYSVFVTYSKLFELQNKVKVKHES